MTSAICIDGFNLVRPQGTGIATYSRNLLYTARSLGLETSAMFGPALSTDALRGFETVALLDPERPASRLRLKQRIERDLSTWFSPMGRTLRPIQVSDDVIWPGGDAARPPVDQCWVARDLFQRAHRAFKLHGRGTPVTFDSRHSAAPAVAHWTTLMPVHARNAPNIYTIHDLIPLRLPHTTLNNKPLFLDMCREVARRADHIAVVSEATRQDVIRMLGVPEDRVTNTYQAVSLPPALVNRSQVEVETELEAAFGLEWGSYFMHFGAVEPKKNLGRVVEAYLASGVSTPLVVVGGPGWMSDPEMALLKQAQRLHGAACRIHQYEYMSYAMLISLIRGAKGILFPSLYEGFGLPVLEAMSLGAPVLTSDQGSLPEVAGDAALQVDPYDVGAVSKGIRKLDADPDWRAEASRRGRIQATKFSQAAYQDRLRDLYARVGVSA
ncbi:glycosyltransferase family 1 protein [Brevundimonas sp. 357]|jgi:glycosyltransferase involved in cell wall biosynthesis|uniref:glycosyltransferase family 4 protein n=1 Tax=Brevundimonas sp. 357 TaxID=2555782 RepID=UPI000F781E86|nr:glycosyltransferase family 1 protein [Brevundimonas sp. 357]RSB42211.1 glycosyltransferase family 1 protein [Brevundimonas sp. 357]